MPDQTIRWVLLVWAVISMAYPLHGSAESRKPTPEQPFFSWSKMQFDPAVHQGRRQRLAKSLFASGGGVFLAPAKDGFSDGSTFRQLDNFLYFTGLELPNSVLAVEAGSGMTHLFVPVRDARFENPSRRNDFPGRPLLHDPLLKKNSGIQNIHSMDDLPSWLEEMVGSNKSLRIDSGRSGDLPEVKTGFIANWTPQQGMLFHLRSILPGAKLLNAHDDVGRLRMVKGPEEIAIIRRACALTASSMLQAASTIRPGVTERDLEAVLEAAFKRGGSPRVAFDSIIKSGPNSLWPWRVLAAHYDRRNRKMVDGDLVIFDVGCEIDHYASDIGRTFPVSGEFSDEQAKRYRLIVKVVDAIIAAAKPGVMLSDLQKVAEATIPESEKKYMQTGYYFGHHIGLDVGDANQQEVKLEPGMIFTVEPWYYNHDLEISVFHEDDILITKKGAENLSGMLPRTPEDLAKVVKRVDPK